MASLLLRGFALGFAIAASPGPIFFLCLRRTLVQGRLYGLFSGFGVASADGLYAAIATLGVVGLTSAFVRERRPLALAGGVVLLFLGISILRQKASDTVPPVTAGGLARAYLSTLGLTIANPATIISFAALAATLSLGASRPAFVVVGVLLGSTAWWCTLAIGASMLRSRLTSRVVRGISAFSGLVIAALGVLAAYTALT